MLPLSLFSVSALTHNKIKRYTNNNDLYKQNNYYDVLNNESLLKTFFNNLNFKRNTREKALSYDPNKYSNGTNNNYRVFAITTDPLGISSHYTNPADHIKISLNKDIIANSYNETSNKTYNDLIFSNYVEDYDKYYFSDNFPSHLNIKYFYKKYDDGYWQDDYWIPNIVEKWYTDQILPTNTFKINYVNKDIFDSLIKMHSYKINSFKNILNFNKEITLENVEIDKNLSDQYKQKYFYNKFDISTKDEINIDFNLTKWHGIDINDTISLIKFLSNNEQFKHIETLFKLFNIKNKNERILIESDTMGNLNTPIDKSIFIGGTSNFNKVQNKLALANKTYEFGNFKLEISYKIKPNREGTLFNLIFFIKNIFYKNTNITDSLREGIYNETKNWSFVNNFQAPNNRENVRKIYLMFYKLLSFEYDGYEGYNVIENIPISFIPSNIYETYGENGFASRLTFKYGLVVNKRSLFDIQNSTIFDFSKQVEVDKPIKLEDASGNYGGKWLINSPLKVEFMANKQESEVLFINNQKIDVLNRHFWYDLKDLRNSADDNERIALNSEDANKPQSELNDTNSRKKNEYIIEIRKYKDNSNNSGEPTHTYKIKFVIVEQSLNQTFKWFAWNPENNPDQKELITKNLEKDGKEVLDKNGIPIPNPKYDEALDKETGTKKQIIWIPKNTLFSNITKHLKFWYPNIDNLNDFGIFAEASVLGKGALRNLIVDKHIDKNKITYFKVQIYSKASNKWINNDELKIEELNANDATSQNAYMSEEGIWLIGSNSIGSISNLKLIIIDKDNSPRNYFLDELKNKLDNNGLSLDKKFEKFWSSTLGINFKFYLLNEKLYNEEQINKINYDDLIPIYNEYVSSSWQYSDLPQIDKSIDIFNDFIWSKLENLNGLTDKQKIKEKVLNYINTNLNDNSLTKNLIKERDYYIYEFTNINDENSFLNELARVSILGTENNKTYKGIKLTLIGKGIYANSKKEIYFKNEAWHIYEPPIDLNSLNITNELVLNISKKFFENKNIPEDVVDQKYRNAISNAIITFINNELNNYKNLTKANGKEIEILLNKDIKINNLNEVIAYLMRGKILKDPINLELSGINANLLNTKTIAIKNIGDGGKFNLQNLSYLFLEYKHILEETNPNNLVKLIKEKIIEIANKLFLEYDKDYSIYLIKYPFYFIDLVVDLNQLDKMSNQFKLKIKEIQEYIDSHKTFEYENKIINVECIPTDMNFLNLINKNKENINDELIRNIINNNLNINIFYKLITILPKSNKTSNFAYINFFNKVNREYKIDQDPAWEEIKPNISEDKENNLKKHVKTWWFGLLMSLLVIGLLIEIIFLIKFIYSKYGGTFGKNVKHKKHKKNSTKKENTKAEKDDLDTDKNDQINEKSNTNNMDKKIVNPIKNNKIIRRKSK